MGGERIIKRMIMNHPTPECLEKCYIATCRLDKATKNKQLKFNEAMISDLINSS